ncbi:hypothetical protein [uncultured Roseobacter sp.]|uniref:hypothetical protein n=1 Tax=uncultured Roseobacter sp. TaxID=114847 RepID=UPI0026247355|nr:hypothetical protein [uncultured Roseobacter sp.]
MGNLWNPFRKNEATPEGVFVVAQLNAQVQPVDRYEYYEAPMAEILQEAGLGEVTGGGTMLLADHAGIQYCDLEILTQDTSPQTLAFLRNALESLGAPKGSLLKVDGLEDMPIGKAEGMGIYLNGTDLPDDVYATSDVNEVIETCEALMEGIGAFRGHWDGNTETGLFFYGESYGLMKAAVTEFVENYPLCARCRFEQVA